MPVATATGAQSPHLRKVNHRARRRAEAMRPKPMPELLAAPAMPFAGQVVALRVTHAAASDHFRWDFAGRGQFASDSGFTPVAHIGPLGSGVHRVAVLIIAGLRTRIERLTLIVRNGMRMGRGRTQQARASARAPVAQPARDPTVTIADFHFRPATVTIHVGDTVTWTNNGPSPHTATASDGSFNSGVLQKGQSASHMFTRTGTFAYFCRIHPFMHGTVVVLPAASIASSSAGTSSGSSSPRASTARVSGSKGTTLPVTGLNLVALLTTGILLTAVGTLLRRAAGC
jgi:plastocyanin